MHGINLIDTGANSFRYALKILTMNGLLFMKQFGPLRRSSFLRHVFILSSGTAISQAIALGFLPILTRLYSPEDFGAFALYLTIASLFFILGTFGYHELIMLPHSNRSAAHIVRVVFYISCAISFLAFLLALFFRDKVAELLGNPEIAPLLFLVPVSTFFFANYQGLRYWTMRMQRFGTVATGQVAKITTSYSISSALPPLSRFFPTGGGLIIGSVFGEIIHAAWLFYSCRKRDRNLFAKMRHNRVLAVAQRHKKMAITLTTSRTLSTVYTGLPAITISSVFGSAALGFFSVAERITSAPALLIANSIGDVYRQRASQLYRESGRFDQLMKKTITATFLIAIIPYAIGIVFAPDIFRIILGPSWEQAGNYASIILVGSFFGFVTTPVDKAPVIVGAHRFIFLFHLLRLVLNIFGASLALFGYIDLMGYVIVLTGIRIVVYCLMTVYCWLYAKGRLDANSPGTQEKTTNTKTKN